jgi:hypothetical protein
MAFRHAFRRCFAPPWRPRLENVLLFLLTTCLYLYGLGSVVPELNAFETWVGLRMPSLDLSWAEQRELFLQIDSNDAMAATNAPQWLLAVRASIFAFGDNPFAHRLPSALISAFSPLLLASIVRRFYRADIAFFVGLLFASSTYQIGFARNAGYVAATVTLLLLMIYLALIITIENRRRPWSLLALAFVLLPFMYAPIRYLWMLIVPPLAAAFVRRQDFRARQWWCLLAFVLAVALAYRPLVGGSVSEASIRFFSARGEQFLYTRRTVDKLAAPNDESAGVLDALEPLLFESLPARLTELADYSFQAKYRHKFFGPHCGTPIERHAWLVLFWVGFARTVVLGRRRRRYLLFPAWSCWTWIPLLVTTGLTPVRLLIGLPADTFLVGLGAASAVDVLPERWKSGPGRLLYLPFAALILWGCSLGARCYFDFPVP